MNALLNERNRSIFSRVVSFVRFLLAWVLAAAVVCAVVAGYFLYDRVDEQVRRHALEMLAVQYPNYSVAVGSAHWVKGVGIRLGEISVVRPVDAQWEKRSELFHCNEVLLHCSSSLQQLVQGKVSISHVQLRGLMLRVMRESDGSWNLRSLLPVNVRRPRPKLTIDNGQVEVVDRPGSPPNILALKNVDLRVTSGPTKLLPRPDAATPYGPDVLAIEASFTSPHCREGTVRGWIDPDRQKWSLEGDLIDLRFSPELLSSLPAEARPSLARLRGLRARANLGFVVTSDSRQSTSPRFAIEGQLMEGRLETPLPNPLTEMTATSVHCDNLGWQVKDLTALYGATQISLSAQGRNSDRGDAVTIWGTAQNLDITPELVAVLPQPFQRQWTKFKPLGSVDADFRAVREQGRWRLETRTQFRSVSLTIEKYPYPLLRAQGSVYFHQDEILTADLWASADHMSEQTPIHLRADIRHPGPNFQGEINVRSHGWLPLNKNLTSPLPPPVQKILRDLAAQGYVTFDATLKRDEQTGDKFQKDISIDIQKGRLRHKNFPYPLEDVRGRVHVTERQWTFEDFEGQNDSCWVKCGGQWLPGASTLDLEFEATDIPCDAQLREAFRGGPRLIWQSLRPTGMIDHAHINLAYQTGMPKPELDIKVTQWRRQNDPERRSLVIQPTWFPIRMDQVSGSVVYHRDGSCELKDLQAVHGMSPRSVDINAHGAGVFRDDGTWEVNLARLWADGLATTPELLSALPHDLRAALTKLRFSGQLSVDGKMWFAGSSNPQTPVTSNWSLLVNVDDGQLQAGPHRIEHLFGQFSIGGGRDGKAWSNAGQARFDSLMYKGIHITEFEGPWRIDPNRLIFGAEAAPREAPPDARHVRARMFGGVAKANGFVSIGPDHAFQIETVFSEADLAEFAKEMATPSQITGLGYARLRLSGNAQVTQSLEGDGNVRLRDANLARLPAIISLVNELRINDARPSVFSSSDIHFQVDGKYLNFDQFDLHGESLTLKGRGSMSLDRPPRVDLAFYTILGGEKRWLPSVRPWLGQASQQFLQIMVTGPLHELQWRREVLPGLNETLQQLFPEQARALTPGNPFSLPNLGNRR